MVLYCCQRVIVQVSTIPLSLTQPPEVTAGDIGEQESGHNNHCYAFKDIHSVACKGNIEDITGKHKVLRRILMEGKQKNQLTETDESTGLQIGKCVIMLTKLNL